MKIGHKIILGFLLIALIMGFTAFFGLYGSKDFVKSIEVINLQSRTIAATATEASSFVKRAEGHLMLFLTLGREEDRDKFFKRNNSLGEQIALLDELVKKPEEIELLKIIKSKR